MSRCKNCGESILWAKRNEGYGFLPPLNFPFGLEVEARWDAVIGDFVATPNMESFTTTFHECHIVELKADDPDAKSTLIKSPVPCRWMSPNEEALKIECPTCGAEPGEWCHTIKDYNRKAVQLHRTRQ